MTGADDREAAADEPADDAADAGAATEGCVEGDAVTEAVAPGGRAPEDPLARQPATSATDTTAATNNARRPR